jgi:streptogramin lyase
MSYKRSLFAIAIALLAGCSSQSIATNPQTPGAASSANQRASGMHASTLQFTVYTAGQTAGFPSTAGAFDIAQGPNQTMWFTDPATPAIGRIDSSGTFTEFSKGLLANAEPYAIAEGPDGNMYFSDYTGIRIGQITPDGTIKEYAANAKFNDTYTKGIAFGNDGRPWVVGFGIPSVIAHLSSDGKIGIHVLPKGFTPDGSLAGDAAGNMWFTGQDRHAHAQLLERVASTGKITRLPMHMVSQRLPCCPNQAAKNMVIGPGGAPWFTTLNYLRPGTTSFHLGTVANNAVQLERITHNGLSYSAYPSGVAASSNGNTIWITGGNPFKSEGALWRFDAKRNQTAYPLGYDPFSIAVDASGNPWFTAAFSGSAAQIVEVTGAP